MRRGLGAMCSSRFRIAWRLRPSGHQWRQDCEPRRADVVAGFELVRGVCSPASSASTSPSSTTEWSDAVECPFETISRNRFFDNVDPVLAHRDRGVSGADLPRESPVSRPRPAGDGAGGPHYLSARHREASAALGGGTVSPHRAMAGGHFPAQEIPGEFVHDLREGLAAVLAAS